ncbi:response regulator transcription factor [Alkaliflexus imshenetskii]|uniref:response regulator transcription factor n=1 Tax=Alkaliflexus imshenetskii TaxID=286730 RepID=UPI00047AB29C|nr:response regulator transcription factor [Alkaliflexus imshenetskii]
MLSPRVNVAIADSQFLVTESLVSIIKANDKFCFAGLACQYHELITILSSKPVDLLITDYATFEYDGIEVFAEFLRKYEGMSILVLTNQVVKHDFNEMTKRGIKNIISKNSDRDELMMAIEATLKRRKYFSEEFLELLMDEGSRKPRIEDSVQLTQTETEIVRMIAEGLTTKEIAARKHISHHTVMTHRKNIFRKLSVNSSSELIMHAIRSGWIDNIEYYI